MDKTQMIDMFLMTNGKYFKSESLGLIRSKLEELDIVQVQMAVSYNYKDPFLMFVLSFFLGSFGVDRFVIGDIGLGVLKLLTIGLCGVFTFVDWFLIMGRTKEKNLVTLMSIY